MRRFIPLLATIALILLLNNTIGSLPALGCLLDPVNGWAANAESADKNFSDHFHIKGLQSPVTISFEDRMVPHIKAENNHDLYFAQGYIHAYFRLWQMDMQTRAAAGRISEIIGKKAVNFDDAQRRKGMVYGAENSLKAMESVSETKEMLDAYSAGINAYIQSLSYRSKPLEYKLMHFSPEPWTNLKCALLLKYMADDLTGYTEDFPLTYLRDKLGKEEFDLLFPEKNIGSKPVIPEGTKFASPSLKIPSAPHDSVFVHFENTKTADINSKFKIQNSKQLQTSIYNTQYTRDIGSNNWAIAGTHTASGTPILCNDPHLGLNLPSLWFEVQLQAPGINSYGVSLPGAPGIVIGFNDSISWGFTNNYRDVKDFYEIYPADGEHYWFNGKKMAYEKRLERISIKDSTDFTDTVLYTIHGPVIYDATHKDPAKTGKQYAVCWMAHKATNELRALYFMNRARNYNEFVKAIMDFQCPAQNFVYADRIGNIAMWGQGQFINKWKGQGRFVMEGKDSLTLWGANIPMDENPHVLNPPQGYVASANQCVTDDSYPYWYNGFFKEWRSWMINTILNNWTNKYEFPVTENSMKILQNNTESFLALSLKNLKTETVFQQKDSVCKQVITSMLNWQKNSDALKPESVDATAFQVWWSFVVRDIWQDDFPDVPANLLPSDEVTMRLLLKDTASRFYDDKNTAQKETFSMIVQKSYKETCDSIEKLKKIYGAAKWYKVKNTSLTHLTKLPAFSYDSLKIGGWANTINAAKGNHGPSWRMIVEMGKEKITAFGVYPGGQSGNPGSKYYSNNINKWVQGKYYSLLFLSEKKSEKEEDGIKYTWQITPEKK